MTRGRGAVARRFARSLDAESARTAVVLFITIPIGMLDADNNADPIASRALWSEAN